MIRRLAFGALLLALSGCPESPSQPLLPPVVAATLENQAEAGTRLRPRFVRGEQVRLFQGWRDTARGEDCRFLPAADGALRCLPGDFSTQYFVDDLCTIPALFLGRDACAPPTTAALVEAGSGCDVRWEVRALGAPLDTVHYLSGGTCYTTPPPGGTAYQMGPALEPSIFVAARRVASPGTESLSTSRLVSDDGATGEYLLADAIEGWLCETSSMLGDWRCLPRGVAFGRTQAFGDPACTEPAFYPPACPAESHVLTSTSNGFAFHRPGALAPAYQSSSGICAPVDVSPGAAQLLGPPLTPERFAAGAVETVGARLQLDVVRYLGMALPARGLFPRDGQGPCIPHYAADGVLRCLPYAPGATAVLPTYGVARGAGGTYADPSCTVPLFPASMPAIGRPDTAGTCPRRARAYRPGILHSGTVYSSFLGCSVYQGNPGDLVRLGEEIPPGSFVPMALE